MTQPDDELLTIDEQLEDRLSPQTRDLEVSEADAAEQAMPADPIDASRARAGVATRAFEANEYDAIEQDRVVEFDDDYR
jgi:hypothetical protein